MEQLQSDAFRVCAVIVTYHPNADMLTNIQQAFIQVHAMVVVDNGSDASERNALRNASEVLGFHFIENGENLGIAEALNRGIRWAIARSYPWVILFDQDSKVTEGFVNQMFATWAVHPDRNRIASVHPKYVDSHCAEDSTAIEPNIRRASDGGPIKSMTSGALMPVWVFSAIGWFASEYFIDEVDSEYCFRIRAAGYGIADSKIAILRHDVGHPTERSILGFSFRPSNHSAMRRYYMSRNRLAVYRKYFWIFPGWISRFMFESFRETVKCFLGEQDRARKFRNLLFGTWDGLIGKMGRREGL